VSAAGPSTRTIVRIVLTVAVILGLLYMLWLVRSVLLLLFVAVFLAIALGPPVAAIHRLGVPRVLSIFTVYLLIAMAIFGVGLLIVPPVVDQVSSLSNDIPGYVKDLQKNRQYRKYDEKYHISDKLNAQAKKLPSKLGGAASELSSITVNVFGKVVQLVTVLTMTFFLLLDAERIAGFFLGLRWPGGGERYRTIAADIYRSTAGYVAGNLLISIIAGGVTYLTLTILGVPFAAPLSVLMAFLDLIPLVGATIGGISIAIVTLFNDFPTSTIVWGIVFLVYQQVENNVIQPIVYRRTVNVAPLIVIVSILIGASLLGILGALVAIPVAAAIQIVLRDVWGRGGPAIEPAAAEPAEA
jgi:predicted PurR-regulated permease PerM